MAKIESLHEVDAKLRQHLLASLRLSDEATVLPQSSRSVESGALKNVVLRLCGSEGDVPPDLFSSNWFSGVSAVKIPTEKAELLLSTPARRAEALRKLVEAIPSEMADSNTQVGAELDSDERERDRAHWTPGFDTASCCVGLFSTIQKRTPDSADQGMRRSHKEYLLVVKAGAGLAGQTFHARLCSALKSGQSLDEALSPSGSPGEMALRRVHSAAKRNRARILLMAAEAMGLYGLDSIGDNACPVGAGYRLAIPFTDTSQNSLTRVDSAHASRTVWQYCAGCVDGSIANGLVTSSNIAEGFLMFLGQQGERIQLKNEAHSCLPFGTPRLLSNRDAVFRAVEQHKRSRVPHPDAAWIESHFGWKAKDFGNGVDLEPPCLWGSHESENFVAEWSRELGISRADCVRVEPEIVAIAATEPSKLRVATRAVAGSQ